MRTWCPLVLALVAGCAAPAEREAAKTAGDSAEVEVALEEAPAAVLEAAKKAVPGIVITSVDKEEEDGKTVYDVEGTVDGKFVEVEVDASGNVLEVEHGDDGPDDDDTADDEGDDD